jgi:hypothetical protein
MMLEELQRRNYSDDTIRHHLRSVTEFAEHFGKPPDKLGLDELRSYQVYLLKERKLSPGMSIATSCRTPKNSSGCPPYSAWRRSRG